MQNKDSYCVSCGQPIESGETGLPDHHCSEQHEAARLAANRAGEATRLPRLPTYGERLAAGFALLGKGDGR